MKTSGKTSSAYFILFLLSPACFLALGDLALEYIWFSFCYSVVCDSRNEFCAEHKECGEKLLFWFTGHSDLCGVFIISLCSCNANKFSAQLGQQPMRTENRADPSGRGGLEVTRRKASSQYFLFKSTYFVNVFLALSSFKGKRCVYR